MNWIKTIGLTFVILFVLRILIVYYYDYTLFTFRILRNYKRIAHIYLRFDHWSSYQTAHWNDKAHNKEFRRHKVAEKCLKEGGSAAIDGIIAELRAALHYDDRRVLAHFLINIGDMKALPIIEELYNSNSFGFENRGIDTTIINFLETNSQDYRQKKNRTEKEASERLARANETVKSLTEDQMIDILRRLCNAYSAYNESEIKNLEPIAIEIGKKTNQKGGIKAMRELYSKIGDIKGVRSLDMHWNGIGEWQG